MTTLVLGGMGGSATGWTAFAPLADKGGRVEWCLTSGRWTLRGPPGDWLVERGIDAALCAKGDSSGKWIFETWHLEFSDPQDALLFKLTWL